MHELPVIQRIIDVCVQHATRSRVKKILIIELEVGVLSDLEHELMQRYFDYVSKGTLAADARLLIKTMPVIYLCDHCTLEFEIEVQVYRAAREIRCPECQEKKVSFISGNEYFIRNIQVV